MVLELRPAHDPRKSYGFVGVVLSLADLSSSVWMWYRDEGSGRRTPHAKTGNRALNGGPQMVEISRDGRRVYLTNGLYTPWDAQFYPDGIRGWMAKIVVAPNGAIAFDRDFLVEFEDGLRPHQVRLQGGDASSDSFCYAE